MDNPPEFNPLLGEEPFQSEESRKLFEAIDKLRSYQVGHDLGDIPEVGSLTLAEKHIPALCLRERTEP
jgi:hypothetical protein